MQALVDHGFNINAVAATGIFATMAVTALDFAGQIGDEKLVKRLIRCGAKSEPHSAVSWQDLQFSYHVSSSVTKRVALQRPNKRKLSFVVTPAVKADGQPGNNRDTLFAKRRKVSLMLYRA